MSQNQGINETQFASSDKVEETKDSNIFSLDRELAREEIRKINEEIAVGLIDKYPEVLREVPLEDGGTAAIFDLSLLKDRNLYVERGDLEEEIEGYDDNIVSSFLPEDRLITYIFSREGLTIVSSIPTRPFTDKDARVVLGYLKKHPEVNILQEKGYTRKRDALIEMDLRFDTIREGIGVSALQSFRKDLNLLFKTADKLVKERKKTEQQVKNFSEEILKEV
jgi:hypothetical protein